MSNNKRLGQYLVESNLITEEDLQSALARQNQSEKKVGEILLDRGLISEENLVKFLSRQTGYMVVNLDNYSVEDEVLKYISEEQARKYQAIPISEDNNTLTVVMQDPFDLSTVDDLRMVTDMDIEPAIATRSEIDRYINRAYNSESNIDRETDSLKIPGSAPGEYDEITASTIPEDQESAGTMINRIVRDSLQNRATHIHFNPKPDKLQIQFRIDKLIHHYSDISHDLYESIISRFRVVSEETGSRPNSEITPTMKLSYGQESVLLRMRKTNSLFGEKVTIDVHREGDYERALEDLGYRNKDLEKIQNVLDYPRGFHLIAGPENSGKTSTLYALLRYLYENSSNPISVEDPVKNELKFCAQVEVNRGEHDRKLDLLNEIADLDPDAVAITNVSDERVVQKSLQIAKRGRKVLVTVNSESALTELHEWAHSETIRSARLAQILVSVITQKLVRVPKQKFLEPYNPEESLLRAIGLPLDYNYKRVEKDSMGPNHFKGMTPLYRIISFNQDLKTCILKRSPLSQFKEACRENSSIRDNAAEKIIKEKTTINEVVDATYRQELHEENSQ